MRKKTEYACIAAFSILSLLMLWQHEAWRDEAQGWLIARDSPSLFSVVRQMGREGTPGLWFYMAYALGRAGLPFRAAQLMSFLTILCVVVIVLRRAPFPPFHRIAFVFGYYVLYEYSVFARTYGLSVLFLTIAAALYRDRFSRPVAYSLAVLLLANTNVHGIILASVLAGAYLFEAATSAEHRRAGGVKAALAVMALGLILAMCQTISREERADIWAGWHWGITRTQVRELFYALELAFVPVSRPAVTFWGAVPVRYPACVLLVVPVFIASLALLRGKRVPAAIYLCATAGLLSLFWLKYPGARRHFGLIYMAWIFCVWAAASYPDDPARPGRFPGPRAAAGILAALLLIQIAGSAEAFYYEMRYDFSPARRVAEYLERNGYVGEDVFLAAFLSTKAQAVALYLPRPYSRIFQVECGKFGSYTAHTREFIRNRNLPIEEVVRRIDEGMRGGRYSKGVLILNERMDGNAEFAGRYELIASFEQHIAEDEPMYIYRLKSPPAALPRR